MCQAHTDLEPETSPATGPVPGSRGGSVPEQLNPSSRQTSLVPSSVMRGGVGVAKMSVAKMSSKNNRGVALLSVSKMFNETEPGVSNSQILGSTTIAKPVTATFANIKLDEHSTGNSPLKRKFNLFLKVCNRVSK